MPIANTGMAFLVTAVTATTATDMIQGLQIHQQISTRWVNAAWPGASLYVCKTDQINVAAAGKARDKGMHIASIFNDIGQ